MKICGIISEYNPFHKGHIYHIEESKKLTGCDTLICVMSGNFVQRGEPSILNKFERSKMAANFADAIIELPCAFSLSSAEDFAYYGIKILDNIKAYYISFGSECGDLKLLQKIADYLADENKNFKKALKSYLKQGHSFAAAKTMAVEENFSKNPEIYDIISKPNNLLAIEYLKALKILKSKIIPVTIKRTGDYNSDKINYNFPSANYIRSLMADDNLNDVKECMDKNSFERLSKNLNKCGKLNEKTLSDLISYKLKISDKKTLKKINGVNEGLENRFIEFSKVNDLEKMLDCIKTKRYPYSKIKRVSMNILLDIDKKTVKKAKKIKPYIKILALNKRKDILSYLSDKKCLSIVRFKDFKLIKNPILKKLLFIDIKSTQIHNLLFKDMDFNDYTNQVFK